MAYCSLKEAYGEDFYNQVNDNYHLNLSSYNSNSMNPSRSNMYTMSSRNGSELSRLKNAQNTKLIAHKQSSDDINAHWRSFDSVSDRIYEKPPEISNDKTIRAWGEVEQNEYSSYVDELSPKEHLKKSLLRDRHINTTHEIKSDYEPSGYLGNMTTYKNLNNSPCQDYFYHLDTCRKCQNKLKKRVIRYFKALQKNNKTLNIDLLPGAKDINTNHLIENELFRDEDDLDRYIENEKSEKSEKSEKNENNEKSEKIIENFQNPTNNRTIFLMMFGLFIIFMMDKIKN
jgi:hypothetical protein